MTSIQSKDLLDPKLLSDKILEKLSIQSRPTNSDPLIEEALRMIQRSNEVELTTRAYELSLEATSSPAQNEQSRDASRLEQTQISSTSKDHTPPYSQKSSKSQVPKKSDASEKSGTELPFTNENLEIRFQRPAKRSSED